MKSLQMQVEFGQKKAMKKVGNKEENLIHCLNLISDSRISASSDFALRNKDTYLIFILNCRSDYLVAYPQKEQKIYKTKLSKMKILF